MNAEHPVGSGDRFRARRASPTTRPTMRAALAAGAGLTLLLSVHAVRAGDPPKGKYNKKEVEIQGVAQTNLTKPQGPPKEQKKESGPTLTIEEFAGQR